MPRDPKNIQRINKTKIWPFEKINKIETPLPNLTKMRREKTHVNKIKNEKEVVTTDSKEIQGIIRDYFENLYSNTLENIEEMGNF
jgi:hypothetical protein